LVNEQAEMAEEEATTVNKERAKRAKRLSIKSSLKRSKGDSTLSFIFNLGG
jgi:GH24 family phage-related lysozyme (muramidase)